MGDKDARCMGGVTRSGGGMLWRRECKIIAHQKPCTVPWEEPTSAGCGAVWRRVQEGGFRQFPSGNMEPLNDRGKLSDIPAAISSGQYSMCRADRIGGPIFRAA